MSDKNDEQKFANMHYPGMRSNPDEGRVAIDEATRWRFAAQIECIGDAVQRDLLGASVFILTGNPMGVRCARRLLEFGFGRVGVFGTEPLAGAHGFSRVAGEPHLTSLNALSKWAKAAEIPSGVIETFSSQSVDRQLDDMLRGFDILLDCRGDEAARELVGIASSQSKPLFIAHATGKRGWVCQLAPGAICAECLELPALAPQAGHYYPALEMISTATAAMVADRLAHRGDAVKAVLETFDFSMAPWPTECRQLTPKPQCPTCSKPN